MAKYLKRKKVQSTIEKVQGTIGIDVDRTVKLKLQDIAAAELIAALASVKGGDDPAAAMKLIEHIYQRIHNNEPLNQTILYELLDHAFGKIIDGESPEQAFGLKQRTAAD